MYRTPRRSRHSSASSPTSESSASVAFALFVVCALRIAQGLLLEPRLGAEASLAIIGAVWALHELQLERRIRTVRDRLESAPPDRISEHESDGGEET